MNDAEAALQQQLPAALRQLQPTALQAIHHQAHHGNGNVGNALSQLSPELQDIDQQDPHNVFHQRLQVDVNDSVNHGHPLQTGNDSGSNVFVQGPSHGVLPIGQGGAPQPQTPQRQQQRPSHYGILTGSSPLSLQPDSRQGSVAKLQSDSGFFQTAEFGEGNGEYKEHGSEMKIVHNPPNLDEWRQRLFDVSDTMTLTEEEYQTYFPHVDNIYSHRSTQRYKRKPFVSHYWDCRLKGRPPGTPKSDDPSKRKRKRTARQRDLCDVKIKITEYFPTSLLPPNGFSSPGPQPLIDAANAANFFAPGQPGGPPMQAPQSYSMLTSTSGFVGAGQPVTTPRYYTIQRVNGNGGNGKGEGVAGPHKHTLEDSDRVKRNSVQRSLIKVEKHVKKKVEKSSEKKTYHKTATGAALVTVKRHAKEHDMKLFGSCFCPFVQRVWIALEEKQIPYQYLEIDPYDKTESFLEMNPRGLVPVIKHGDFVCGESTVLLEYIEDLHLGTPLLPVDDPQTRAHCRLWIDHINRHIVPLFYSLLQVQDGHNQASHAESLKDEITKLVDASDPTGPFFLGTALSLVDVQFAPFMLRLSRVLKPYRGWPDAEVGSRWGLWLEAVEGTESVKATTSGDELYLDSYQRYAENRPNTSQVQEAINSGRPLP